MVEYKLTKEEGKMLHRVIGDVLNRFELAFKEFNTYADALYMFDNLENNDFRKLTFETKEDVKSGVIALNMVMEYVELMNGKNMVYEVNILSTILIDLYEHI